MFTGVSGEIAPGNRPELHFAFQIDTTLSNKEFIYIHSLKSYWGYFYRTPMFKIRISYGKQEECNAAATLEHMIT